MERLHELVAELQANLPTCFACRKPVSDTNIYMIFSCYHFLCTGCANLHADISHPQCGGQPIQVDYPTLNRDREEMAKALSAFHNGNKPAFPSVFAAYYRFLGRIAKLTSEAPRPVQEEEKSAPAESQQWQCTCGEWWPLTDDQCKKCFYYRSGVLRPASQTWTCKCGVIYPLDAAYCQSCKFYNLAIKRAVCAKCHSLKCCCPDMMSLPANIWACVCGYEYNTDEDARCKKCGKAMPGLEG